MLGQLKLGQVRLVQIRLVQVWLDYIWLGSVRLDLVRLAQFSYIRLPLKFFIFAAGVSVEGAGRGKGGQAFLAVEASLAAAVDRGVDRGVDSCGVV